MKKMLAILMALLMAALLLPAYAEEGDVAEIAEIAGTVLEIGEESILLETPEGQLIEAILTADTIREGKEIAEGDFIHVMYNGQMTRSYPAQVTAQHIGCYVLTGTVSDITDEGFTLTTDETTYIVHATAEQLAQITDGAEINVYFSGVIATSLPGQISAEQITAVEEEAVLTGTVVEAYITMETADGQQIQVNLTSLTQLPDGIPDLGETVRVTYNGQMTRSIPAQVTADTIDIAVTIDELAGEIVEITGDGILLQTKDMQVLVNVDERDFGSAHPLAGIEFQEKLEKKAFALGGGTYFAPVQKVGDFLAGRGTLRLGAVKPSYKPGVMPADFRELFDAPLYKALQEGIRRMDRKLRGFAADDAVLTAVESRSSSPVRIVRGADYMSNIHGVYPAGEGAGYAGGITSAAADGVKLAAAICGIG